MSIQNHYEYDYTVRVLYSLSRKFLSYIVHVGRNYTLPPDTEYRTTRTTVLVRAYCAPLGVAHFHWLISAPNLAASSITARSCASIEFALIPKGAQYARIRNEYVQYICALLPKEPVNNLRFARSKSPRTVQITVVKIIRGDRRGEFKLNGPEVYRRFVPKGTFCIRSQYRKNFVK